MASDLPDGDPYYAYRQQARVDAKVVVMGNAGVGKTSIVQRYTENKFTPTGHTSATVGARFVTKKVTVDGVRVSLQIWDTAGEERFRSVAPMYYRNANAALLVYDITEGQTFEDVRGWLEELKKNCTGDLIIYIVGAKADLSKHRMVSQDRVRHSLHVWFPPPRPPSPPQRPVAQPNFSYIRPLFGQTPSLVTSSSSSVPFPSTTPSLASDTSGSYVGLSRSNTTALAQSRMSNPGPGLARSPTAPTRRPNNRARSDAALLGRPDAAVMASALDDPKPGRLSPIYGSRFGRAVAWNDGVDGFEDSDVEDDREWGLEKDMKLFEVSAKDSRGINNLFDTLVAAIVSRREVIEKERLKRERDSVVLHGITPGWRDVAEEEDTLQREREKTATWSVRSWTGGCC